MQSMERNVSNFEVDAVLNRKPVKLLKRCVGIGLVGIKQCTNILTLMLKNLYLVCCTTVCLNVIMAT